MPPIARAGGGTKAPAKTPSFSTLTKVSGPLGVKPLVALGRATPTHATTAPAHDPGPAHGDVLDRALHVARAQAAKRAATPTHALALPTLPAANPNLTKPQAGFFGAVAGKGQPSLQQTSRIAHPFATNPVIGGAGATVVSPIQQAQLAASTLGQTPAQRLAQTVARDTTPTLGNVALPRTAEAAAIIARGAPLGTKPQQAHARTVEASLAGPADHTVKTTTRTGPGVGSGLTIAATAPQIVSYASKLHNVGIPLASLSMPLQAKIKDAFTTLVTHAPSYQYAGIKNIGWFSAADKAKAGLGADATDADYLRKVYAPFLGHATYLGGLLDNVPRNTLELAAAPAGLAQLAGHDLGAGIVRGDWKPAKTDVTELGREQVQFARDLYNHPAQTIQKNPVTVATSLFGVGRGLGAAAGLAARSDALAAGAGALGQADRAAAVRAFATPAERRVVPAGLDDVRDVEGNVRTPQPISRGMTSKNLYDRVGQAAADWAASHVPALGRRLDKVDAQRITKDEARSRNEALRTNVEPAVKAAQKLSRKELTATLFAHGQGVLPSQLRDFFAHQLELHKTLEQDSHGNAMTANDEHAVWKATNADLLASHQFWTKVHAKVGDDLTPKMADALAKSTHASRAAEVEMSGQHMLGSTEPLVSDEAMLRRAYIPMARIRAAAGDESAQSFLDLDHERQTLEAQMDHAGTTDRQASVMQREIDSIRNEQVRLLEKQRGKIQKKLADAKTLRVPASGPADDLAAERAIGNLKVQRAKAAAQLVQAGKDLVASRALRPAAARTGGFAGSVHELIGKRMEAARDVRNAERGLASTDDPKALARWTAQHAAASDKVETLNREIAQARSEDTAMQQTSSLPSLTPGQKPLLARSPGEVRAIQTRHAQLTSKVADIDEKIAQARADQAAMRGTKVEPAISPMQPATLKGSPARIAKLEAKLAKREDQHASVLSGEWSNARIIDLQSRLDEAPTLARLQGQHAQVSREAGEALAKLRNAHRGVTAGPDFVGPQERELGNAAVAPLDVHDPLYFPHVPNTKLGLKRGRFGTNDIRTLSKNPRPKYGSRLGFGGEAFNGGLLASGRATPDPSTFFGAAAKPSGVAAALRHIQAQISAHAFRVEGGETYNPENHVLLNLGPKSVEEHPITKGARTPLDVDQASTDFESGQWRDKLMSHFTDHGDANRATAAFRNSTNRVVPQDGDEYVLVSRSAYDQMRGDLAAGRHSKLFQFAQKTTRFWRWSTLLARPAWLVNNVVGNAAQATLAGAGPTSWIRALRTNDGDLFAGTVPARAQNNGLFRDVFGSPNPHVLMGPIHAVQKLSSYAVRANIAYENLARRAVYLSKAVPEAKRLASEQEGRSILKGFHRANDQVIENLKQMATDEQAAPRIVKTVYQWLGDFQRVKQTPGRDLLSPFHSWFTFVTKLTLTMPAKTPGRALLLQRLGEFGVNVMANQTGGFTSNSLQGAFQLPQNLPLVGGYYKTTQGLNPLATDFQLLSPNDQSTLNPGYPTAEGLLGAFNPYIGALGNFATGRDFQTGTTLKDATGQPAGSFNPLVLGNQLENSIPLATTLAGYSHNADTSINPLSPLRLRPSKTAQPVGNRASRVGGYVGFTSKPLDPVLNQVVRYDALKKTIKARVKARAERK